MQIKTSTSKTDLMESIDYGIIQDELDDMQTRYKFLAQLQFLQQHQVATPEIGERKKGDVIQYYTTVPARYSQTGKRHQIVANTHKDVLNKFRKEVYTVLSHQIDLTKYQNATVGDIVRDFLQHYENHVKPQTMSKYWRVYYNHIDNTNFSKININIVKKYHCDDYMATVTDGAIVLSYVQ